MFNIGSYIINFDYFAVVKDILPNGDLIVENNRIGRWVADPKLCKAYIPPVIDEERDERVWHLQHDAI